MQPSEEHESGVPFDTIFNAARTRALAWALRRTDFDTAEDIATEAAMNIWERKQKDPSFLAAPGELERYAATAACNALMDHRRADQRRFRREARFEGESRECVRRWMCPAAGAESRETRDAIKKALRREILSRRQAWYLVRVRLLTYVQAARQLGVTPRVVRTSVNRVEKMLRRELAGFRLAEAA